MNTLTLPVNAIEKVERKLKSALEELSDLKKKQAKKAIRFWTKAEWEKHVSILL